MISPLTNTVDHLGQIWPHDKLDDLLRDPEVAATVEEMDRTARIGDGVFQLPRARSWAASRGRSEAGLALLMMLWWRRLEARLGGSS